MALQDRNLLGFDAHLFQSPNGYQRLLRAFFHPAYQRRHCHQAGYTKNDPQHGQQRTEFMSPNFPQTGLREIWAHKFRSLLTMLGIILGVSSLVAMSALVSGMEKGAKEALVAIGVLEKVRIEAQEIPIDQRHLMDQAVGITVNDVYALEQ